MHYSFTEFTVIDDSVMRKWTEICRFSGHQLKPVEQLVTFAILFYSQSQLLHNDTYYCSHKHTANHCR